MRLHSNRLLEDGPRPPGSDAERRAARAIERRLGELGRAAVVEHVDLWPRWPQAHALHALAAIAGSLIAVDEPTAGLVIVALAFVSVLLDAVGVASPLRRLLGRRASQNVISREDGGKPGTLLLVVSVATARGGAALARRVDLLLAALALLSACCALRVAGLEGVGLTIVQFIPTVALIVAVPLLLDMALSRGTEDEAGIATALGLDRPLEHFDLWLLLTGNPRSFRRRHRRELAPERTALLQLGADGSPVLGRRSPPELVRLAGEISEDWDGEPDGPALVAELVRRLDAEVGPRLT